jgi:hypothetical protein
MRFHFEGKEVTNKEVAQNLDARYPRLSDGRWETPFGISFAEPVYIGDKYAFFDWVFIYDEEGSALSHGLEIKKGEPQRWLDSKTRGHASYATL